MSHTNGDIVLVTWLDAARQTDWTYSKPSTDIIPITSVGFLIVKNERVTVVQPHRHHPDAEGDIQHVGDMVIPSCAVISVESLVPTPIKTKRAKP